MHNGYSETFLRKYGGESHDPDVFQTRDIQTVSVPNPPGPNRKRSMGDVGFSYSQPRKRGRFEDDDRGLGGDGDGDEDDDDDDEDEKSGNRSEDNGEVSRNGVKGVPVPSTRSVVQRALSRALNTTFPDDRVITNFPDEDWLVGGEHEYCFLCTYKTNHKKTTELIRYAETTLGATVNKVWAEKVKLKYDTTIRPGLVDQPEWSIASIGYHFLSGTEQPMMIDLRHRQQIRHQMDELYKRMLIKEGETTDLDIKKSKLWIVLFRAYQSLKYK